MKRCFFIGHRDPCDELLPQLMQIIEHHIIIYGVEEFIVGVHGGFDRIALKALALSKERFPSIRIYLLTAFHPAIYPLTTPPYTEGALYPPDMERVPPRYAIVHANRYMINHTDFLIANLKYAPSNTATFIRFAQKKHGVTITFVDT